MASVARESDTIATISEIEPLSSDPNNRRLRVGRRTVAVLRASDVDALQLSVGSKWTPAVASAVEAAIAAFKARREAMNLLGRRALSRMELIDRLIKKQHDRSLAEQIADELAAQHWLDDAAYGQAIVQQTLRTTPVAAKLLEAKLRARKIEPTLASNLARGATAGQDDISAARTIAKRQFERLGHVAPAKAIRRVAALLARRGFDEDVVRSTLQQMGFDAIDRSAPLD